MPEDKDNVLGTRPFVRTVDIHTTAYGSDWYWAVMSVMGATMLVILGTSILKRPTDRILHYILAAVAFIAMVEHYTMAAGLGWVPVSVEWQRPQDDLVAGISRQIWWARYCGWFLIWPLVTFTLLLGIAAPAIHILSTCFLSASMATMALAGGVVRTGYKWGYYGFWIWALMLVGYQLIRVPRRLAKKLDNKTRFTHRVFSLWVWLLWICYPICWGISEGGNVIAPDSEFVFYGILDCCLIPITAAFFLAAHWRTDTATLGIHFSESDGLVPSKNKRVPDLSAVTNRHTSGSIDAGTRLREKNIKVARDRGGMHSLNSAFPSLGSAFG